MKVGRGKCRLGWHPVSEWKEGIVEGRFDVATARSAYGLDASLFAGLRPASRRTKAMFMKTSDLTYPRSSCWIATHG